LTPPRFSEQANASDKWRRVAELKVGVRNVPVGPENGGGRSDVAPA
jgi:hypothetical protein